MASNRTIGTGGASTTDGVVFRQGGYRELKSYQSAEIVHDATVDFCALYIPRKSPTHDQMVQAAHSGKQNIAEGSEASATSKKAELKLTGVARASLEGLLLDCEDFLRRNELDLWDKNSPDALKIRALAYESDRSYKSYKSHVRRSSESGANTLICLVNQATYLLRRQMEALERQYLHRGGFTENLYRARKKRKA
ncbi:four helix bundle suffix domain-containing protein [Verrucomicrobiota bacterium]